MHRVMGDPDPSLDIRLESPVAGTITYRVYSNFPQMIAYTRRGKEMQTYKLGISPADIKIMDLLSDYLKELYVIDNSNAEKRRQAFWKAAEETNSPPGMARALGPVIVSAAEELSKQKLEQLSLYQPCLTQVKDNSQ